ncbi:NTP transferase domain-containing protein [Sphingobium subterraneum]|uniref:GTP:adenosylcobinamide-phosphate guanylyltransferase n=1 Tax=Sphingobium subterraneum TaxID=627688 RepID=A0A841J4G2_9SPHN|nr:NTP transferase domain-containing protein [Sphingobium subterraneum]MBB6124406.1 GTP:adenosylcobinamide-phosphate guanylyltransferase [Sphingobium subterraneum]
MSVEPSFQVLVLAGSRPGTDPLAAAAGVATKALVPIAGRPMLDHVVRVLVDHPRVGPVIILAQQAETLADHPQTTWMLNHPDIRFADSGAGISQSLLDLIDGGQRLPLLVTTADNVLIDAAIIDAFLDCAPGSDLAVAMVERATLLAAYPQSRRTWLKFRGGWWSGANLFWLGNDRARAALSLWRGIEQDRKKGWKIVSAFGPLLLVGAALRLLTIQRAIAIAGRRIGLVARVVAMPVPEACIDADKRDDIILIEQILARRGA